MKQQDRITILVTILALLVSMAGMAVGQLSVGNAINDRMIVFVMICGILPLLWVYTLLILKRVNPHKYIFFSYAKTEEDLSNKISLKLEEELNNNSKYRYEILIGDNIPLGTNMSTGIKELIEKSAIVIVIVSEGYLLSEWCITEFKNIDFEKQKVIPIVYSDFSLLSKLPVDLSEIKGLSLTSSYSDRDISELVKTLSKDIKRNQT